MAAIQANYGPADRVGETVVYLPDDRQASAMRPDGEEAYPYRVGGRR